MGAGDAKNEFVFLFGFRLAPAAILASISGSNQTTGNKQMKTQKSSFRRPLCTQMLTGKLPSIEKSLNTFTAATCPIRDITRTL